MDIVLSSSHQQRFAAALRALLSPLAYASTLEWRLAVNRSLQQLLDADHVTFGIPGGAPELVSSDGTAEVIGSGGAHPQACRFAISERELELGAFNRELLLGIQLPAHHESEYSHDYIVVNQAFDWLALVAATTSDPGSTRVAHIVLHKDAATGRGFGNRGLALARLLFPGFRSGVITHSRMAEERRVLGGVIDRLLEGMLVCDPGGKVMYQSAVLTSMLHEDPDGDELLARMQVVGRRLATLLGAPERRRRDAELIETVRTEHACYRVRGTIVGEGVLSAAFRIMVALEQLSPVLPAEADVRERFRLTPKEARVCLLLARGRTNEEIAGDLCVTRHTARRHTEKVLLKLQVKSRAEIAPTLLEFSSPRQATEP